MPVEPVSAPVPASMYATKNTRAPKQEYDSELFLELLVTQLRNQDPSSSMDTGEIVSQTTSLAMMEALTRMSGLVEESFALQMRQSAADLLGNQVSYLDADGVEHTGIATAVSYHDAVPTVTIGGVTVELDHVSAVTSSVSTDATGTPAATDGATDDHGSSAA
ncbi:flagellar hook capping protein [Cellulosimicrobium cellulans]|uniref:flagellar hook capping FlgD N-terminal domain-containing protein n=1 Tax=Cellulosimicrobium TaxID=157920 RepID=UPI0008892CE4|nr:flagellar hook capping FlgD N-terminal domain-containing protein [Sphaerisporangium cinnabarinum]MCR1983501.1 flagellar hook capping protein [Cellulosimicrobium cellulans]SDF79453.1 flagellar basal-body rod modification protein FlgD [Cellulosimicrobium cellulans]